jgi:hypothetical protein
LTSKYQTYWVACSNRFPYEGVRLLAVSEKPSPETQMPLVRLVALQSFIDVEVSDVLGCLFPL